ncbi:MAG: sulfite exporter TauE/SafE family protein [Dehalococcoidia bacterium]
MKFFRECGEFMMAGSRAQARWDKSVSDTILGDRRRLFILFLLLIPILVGGYALADSLSNLPDTVGGKEGYSPSEYSLFIFGGSIIIGLVAGLISGCIGAGGGFVITPALMSIGVKGIMAVGTDLFHIFAKAIMGSVIHRKLGNVCVLIAVVFVVGSLVGSTLGGMINRSLYEKDPNLSDAFITIVYSVMLGLLGSYAMYDYLKNRKSAAGQVKGGGHGGALEAEELSGLPKKLQSINIPPMIKFDEKVVPGGRKISWVFLVVIGFFVGLAASIMGVGGGFITFPAFVYGLGISAATTVGTDIFQIVFTGSWAAISQYALYGYIFYTLAMGMLLGSLVGVQIGALVTKVVTGSTIRGFFAIAVLAGFVNRVFALPAKVSKMEWVNISSSTTSTLEDIGKVLFFIVMGIFMCWVIGTFLKNISRLKGTEHGSATLQQEEAKS